MVGCVVRCDNVFVGVMWVGGVGVREGVLLYVRDDDDNDVGGG